MARESSIIASSFNYTDDEYIAPKNLKVSGSPTEKEREICFNKALPNEVTA